MRRRRRGRREAQAAAAARRGTAVRSPRPPRSGLSWRNRWIFEMTFLPHRHHDTTHGTPVRAPQTNTASTPHAPRPLSLARQRRVHTPTCCASCSDRPCSCHRGARRERPTPHCRTHLQLYIYSTDTCILFVQLLTQLHAWLKGCTASCSSLFSHLSLDRLGLRHPGPAKLRRSSEIRVHMLAHPHAYNTCITTCSDAQNTHGCAPAISP